MPLIRRPVIVKCDIGKVNTLSEYLLIHARHHACGMGVAEVCVALNHLQGLVPENFCELAKGGARYEEIACGGMPQVVEAKIR